MALATTEWPSTTIPQPVKDIVAKFFEIGDSTSEDASYRLGHEVFAPEGQITVNERSMNGAAGIAAGHKEQMAAFKGRRHKVDKIYTCNEAADDLLLIGNVERYLHDGRTIGGEFAARLVIETASSQEPRLKLFHAWSDFSKLIAALSEK